ncbi:hypothetical protein JOQ06_005763, partial [Pogonophryne albipinna]
TGPCAQRIKKENDDDPTLKPVGKKYNPDTTEVTEKKVPPGLLKKFGPMPKN